MFISSYILSVIFLASGGNFLYIVFFIDSSYCFILASAAVFVGYSLIYSYNVYYFYYSSNLIYNSLSNFYYSFNILSAA